LRQGGSAAFDSVEQWAADPTPSTAFGTGENPTTAWASCRRVPRLSSGWCLIHVGEDFQGTCTVGHVADQLFLQQGLDVADSGRTADSQRVADFAERRGVAVEVAVVADDQDHVGLSGGEFHAVWTLLRHGRFRHSFDQCGEVAEVGWGGVFDQPNGARLVETFARLLHLYEAGLNHCVCGFPRVAASHAVMLGFFVAESRGGEEAGRRRGTTPAGRPRGARCRLDRG
jgi:hypothetical protein